MVTTSEEEVIDITKNEAPSKIVGINDSAPVEAEIRNNEISLEILRIDTVSVYSSDTESRASVTKYLPQDASVGTFGEVNVVNSSEVHFGNKIFTSPITVVSADEENVEKLGIKDILDKYENSKKKSILQSKYQTKRQLIFLTCIVLLLIIATATAAVIMALSLGTIDELVTPEELYINESWFLTRDVWKADPMGKLGHLSLPVKYALIGHTAGHQYMTREQCITDAKHIQIMHMLEKRMDDIAYNYMLCGNGDILEGRGANKRGAHTFGVNSQSIIIALMGDYNRDFMMNEQIDHALRMIEEFVKQGKIREDYSLITVDQVAGMESPGTNAKKIIETWNNYDPNPNVNKNV